MNDSTSAKGDVVGDSPTEGDRRKRLNRTGFWTAILTAVLAAVSFGVAATTPPRTGPFAAPGTAIPYPYDAAAEFVPRDFVWMYLGLLMMLAFLVLAACVREHSPDDRKVFGTLGLCFAVVSFTVIALDYFVQLRTVQPSLLQGEFEGLAIISQYNPHSVFIALEELGFLVMLNPATGKEMWRERAGSYWGSIVLAEGRGYCSNARTRPSSRTAIAAANGESFGFMNMCA